MTTENIIQIIRSLKKETASERTELIDGAVEQYEETLPSHKIPGREDVEAAAYTAEAFMRERLQQGSWLPSGEIRDVVKERFRELSPMLHVPTPPVSMVLTWLVMGLSGFIGALAGLILLAPLIRLATGVSETGLMVGAPIGAFLLPMLVWHVSRSKWLQRTAAVAIGLAGAAELWGFVRSAGWAGLVWQKLGGSRSGKNTLIRVAIYTGIILLIVFAKRKPEFHKEQHMEDVRQAVEGWLDHALTLLAALAWSDCDMLSEREQSRDDEIMEAFVAKVGRELLELHHCPKDDLPYQAEMLLQAARNQGFENLGGTPVFMAAEESVPIQTFSWAEEFAERFRTYGHIVVGDMVYETKSATIMDGKVMERGMVRKHRRGNIQ